MLSAAWIQDAWDRTGTWRARWARPAVGSAFALLAGVACAVPLARATLHPYPDSVDTNAWEMAEMVGDGPESLFAHGEEFTARLLFPRTRVVHLDQMIVMAEGRGKGAPPPPVACLSRHHLDRDPRLRNVLEALAYREQRCGTAYCLYRRAP